MVRLFSFALYSFAMIAMIAAVANAQDDPAAPVDNTPPPVDETIPPVVEVGDEGVTVTGGDGSSATVSEEGGVSVTDADGTTTTIDKDGITTTSGGFSGNAKMHLAVVAATAAAVYELL